MIEHHSSVNYFNDFRELQIMCTSTLNCTDCCLLLLAKTGEGHIKIRPEYVSVIAHKTSFCKHNFVHFLVRIV